MLFGLLDPKPAALTLDAVGHRATTVLDLDMVRHLVAGHADRTHRNRSLKLDVSGARFEVDIDRAGAAAVVGVHESSRGQTVVVRRRELDGHLCVLRLGEIAGWGAQNQGWRSVWQCGDRVLDRLVVSAAVLVLALDPIGVVAVDGESHFSRSFASESAPEPGAALEHDDGLGHWVVESSLKHGPRAHKGLDIAVRGSLIGQARVVGQIEMRGHLHHCWLVHRGQLESIGSSIPCRDVVVHLSTCNLQLPFPALILAGGQHQRLPVLPSAGPPQIHGLRAMSVDLGMNIDHRAGRHVLIAGEHLDDPCPRRRRDGLTGQHGSPEGREDALWRDQAVEDEDRECHEESEAGTSKSSSIDNLVRSYSRAEFHGLLAHCPGNARIHVVTTPSLKEADQLVVRAGHNVFSQFRRVWPADRPDQRSQHQQQNG